MAKVLVYKIFVNKIFVHKGCAIAGALLFLHCGKYSCGVELPQKFETNRNSYRVPVMPDSPRNNLPAESRIKLGRKLFSERLLSGSNRTSCADCHRRKIGWSNGQRFARADSGRRTKKNVPSLINVGFKESFDWRGHSIDLEKRIQQAIRSPYEMNERPQPLIAELDKLQPYRYMFKLAYAMDDISPEIVARALAAYLRTIISAKSSFDRMQSGDASAISGAAKRGYALFRSRAGCMKCHSGPHFSDRKFHRSITGGDMVRTPSLRDVARSSPYMQDGSLATLEDVMMRYNADQSNQKGKINPAGNAKNPYQPLSLNFRDRNDIIAFLRTLNGQ